MTRYIVFVLCFVCVTAHGNGAVAPNLKLNDGRQIPAFALGTWLGNNSRGRVEPTSEEVEKAVIWAIEAGYRHIDTAYIYQIEDQVGKGVSKKIADGIPREELFITTKLWNSRHAREEVEPALRESLAKLQLDYVDLYLIHWPVGQFNNQTYDYTDYLETWRGMIDVKKKGLTKSIGLSNFNQKMMDRIAENGLEKPAVLQVELNLNLQQPELLAYCKQHDIAVMGYTPFGSLFPFKAKDDAPPPRVNDPALLTIANAHGKTVPQIALRYLDDVALMSPFNFFKTTLETCPLQAYLVELGVIPIPKSLTKTRIEQNIDIFNFQLAEEEKSVLKSFDKNYRTIPQYKWLDHPYYPFEKKETE